MNLTRTPIHARATRVERYDTVVIGGSQAGLAVGYHLAQRDADFVILDAERRIGDAWRRRWDSLRLFTPAAYGGLPRMPFPAPQAHLPDKDEVADHLERYAERFDLPVRLESRVDSLSWDGERNVLRVGDMQVEAANVIVATNAIPQPRIPAVSPWLAPDVHQLHSSQYRNPFDLPDGPMLVVGAGNSGAQIALELVMAGQSLSTAAHAAGFADAAHLSRTSKTMFGFPPSAIHIAAPLEQGRGGVAAPGTPIQPLHSIPSRTLGLT